MTQCIKCNRSIPDGELFCAQCSKLPVIAELNDTTVRSSSRTSGRAAAPRRQTSGQTPVRKQAPHAAAEKKKSSGKTKAVIVCLSVLLVLSLGALVWQQSSLTVEENRLRTRQEQIERERARMEQTETTLAETKLELQMLEQTLKEKELEIKTLSAQLADSKSTQNQGQYDLTQMKAELETLQEEYNTMKEDYDRMVQAVEAAAGYKEKAEFLDKYVVFVEDNGTRYYHCYDCEDFTQTSFWTYSPKLAQAQGFKACPKCSQ